MTPQQKAQFFSKFATLLNCGFSIQEIIDLLVQQSDARLARYLNKVSAAVALGEDLASALAHAPRYFDRWTISLIQIADYSGALPEMFYRLSQMAQQQHYRSCLYRSVKIAAITTLVSVLGLIITLLYTSESPILVWVLVALLLAGLGFVAPKMAPRFPLIRRIFTAHSMLELAELELPLNCGIPVLTAIELVRDRIPKSSKMSGSLTIALGQIPAGYSFSQTLEGRLPTIAIQIIRTGEETGHLNVALQKLADYYNRQLEQTLHLLQAILIPISLLAAGGLVAVLVMEALTSLLILLPN
ncbi:type II secretion system F family protein [Limnoraphis robusta]|jgi:type II secretory pathway component PulF|uniref:Type II secretion system F family protein n=1 Tax=Limnoraphis robusta CCNP1315 TaxID=3110306 RepID=A0ABU5TXZ3_9CYAN|nr:type II secretion system F family protein [Limnoraphis robusta]MCG5056903.1 type II secretion system F family protein [Limnoraphis sp. WC205]MEA5519791.1 type II secretion system F family protein [Limnoraphis robusta CCNP1315]MEA5548168.1 type II secretion system F family protein [Limnoraphis robusta CCNP1324]